MFLPCGFVACQRGLGKRAAPREGRRALPRGGMLNENHGADDYFIARVAGCYTAARNLIMLARQNAAPFTPPGTMERSVGADDARH
jgi:hypothetical protein